MASAPTQSPPGKQSIPTRLATTKAIESMKFIPAAILGAMFILPGQAATAAAPSVETFYAANRLTIVNGYTPGSVYDLYARVLTRHIYKHIPGTPAVIWQNMP